MPWQVMKFMKSLEENPSLLSIVKATSKQPDANIPPELAALLPETHQQQAAAAQPALAPNPTSSTQRMDSMTSDSSVIQSLRSMSISPTMVETLQPMEVDTQHHEDAQVPPPEPSSQDAVPASDSQVPPAAAIQETQEVLGSHSQVQAAAAAAASQEATKVPASHSQVPAPAVAASQEAKEVLASHSQVPAPAAAASQETKEVLASHSQVPAPAAAAASQESKEVLTSHSQVSAPAAAASQEATKVPAAPAAAASQEAKEVLASHSQVSAPAAASQETHKVPSQVEATKVPASHSQVPAAAPGPGTSSSKPRSQASSGHGGGGDPTQPAKPDDMPTPVHVALRRPETVDLMLGSTPAEETTRKTNTIWVEFEGRVGPLITWLTPEQATKCGMKVVNGPAAADVEMADAAGNQAAAASNQGPVPMETDTEEKAADAAAGPAANAKPADTPKPADAPKPAEPAGAPMPANAKPEATKTARPKVADTLDEVGYKVVKIKIPCSHIYIYHTPAMMRRLQGRREDIRCT